MKKIFETRDPCQISLGKLISPKDFCKGWQLMPTLKTPQQCGGNKGTSKQFEKIMYFMLGDSQ